MRTKVSEKGQITIPKPLRDQLGIRVGMELEFTTEKGRLVGIYSYYDGNGHKIREGT